MGLLGSWVGDGALEELTFAEEMGGVGESVGAGESGAEAPHSVDAGAVAEV